MVNNQNLICHDFKSRIGNTRLIKLESISKKANANIYVKLESENPTGSHKDRESLALALYCKTSGISDIGCASTGNFAISLAYISSILGLRCHVWVDKSLSIFRENYLKAFRANLYKIDGKLIDIYKKSSQEMRDLNIYDANPGQNQIKINANSEITKEIQSQLPQVNTIITCVNNGTHFLGMAKGITLQSVAMNGVYTYVKKAKSIAGFTCFEGLEDLQYILRCQKGKLIEAFKSDIENGLDIAYGSGLIIEASSAATLGIALRTAKKNENICCVLTGNGLKYPDEIL